MVPCGTWEVLWGCGCARAAHDVLCAHPQQSLLKPGARPRQGVIKQLSHSSHTEMHAHKVGVLPIPLNYSLRICNLGDVP